jgi:hypothetical protein
MGQPCGFQVSGATEVKRWAEHGRLVLGLVLTAPISAEFSTTLKPLYDPRAGTAAIRSALRRGYRPVGLREAFAALEAVASEPAAQDPVARAAAAEAGELDIAALAAAAAEAELATGTRLRMIMQQQQIELHLCRLRLMRKEPSLAVAACQEAVEHNPVDERGHYMLGQAHFDNGDFKVAQASMTVALTKFGDVCRRCKCCSLFPNMQRLLQQAKHAGQ